MTITEPRVDLTPRVSDPATDTPEERIRIQRIAARPTSFVIAGARDRPRSR